MKFAYIKDFCITIGLPEQYNDESKTEEIRDITESEGDYVVLDVMLDFKRNTIGQFFITGRHKSFNV